MVKIRKSADRGRTSTGWIHSAHTFSFGSYFDVQHQGHGNLLVLNEDIVESGKGFGNHGHQDMEIISYVLGGELAHQDKIETGTAGSAYTGIVQYGDIQRVSAGFGMQHSELNNLPNENTHFLQIWIKPNVTGIHPSYEKKHFIQAQRRGKLALIASSTGIHGSVSMNADAAIEAGLFDGQESFTKPLDPARITYVHLARGELRVNGYCLSGGDGALLEAEPVLILSDGRSAEVLVFDLAPI